MHDAEHRSVIIVGAGPGGLSVAAALLAKGISPKELLVLDKGEVGQAWLDYPAETHLLSESAETFDHNMIADIPFKEFFPHIPHPSHELYQRYLQDVVNQLKIPVTSYVTIKSVTYDQEDQLFHLKSSDQREFSCEFVVWAAGMFSTPSENLESDDCYIHYAKVPDFTKLTEKDVSVIGSGNGASGVVMALAKPGRLVRMVIPHEYTISEPIDCLWKENMEFVKQMEMQGLVEIVENFRVKTITKEGGEHGKYVIHSATDSVLNVPTKPIVCIGFEPSIEPLNGMVGCTVEGHDWTLELTSHKESKLQPGLFLAGTLARRESEEAFIREFRKFGPIIAKEILGRKQL